MISLQRIFFTMVFAGTATALFAQGPANQLLTEAQAAYGRGDLAAAKAKFESVLALDPRNPVATGFLKQIQVKLAQQNSNPERALSSLIIPKIEFKEAELSAALDALRQQVTAVSGGRQSVNFVQQLSPEQSKVAVTLSLSNIPFTEALKYLGQLASVTFSYDRYAITVRPAGAAAPTPPAP